MKRVVIIASMLLSGCTLLQDHTPPSPPIPHTTTSLSKDSTELKVTLPDSKLRQLAHEVALEVDKKTVRRGNGILSRQPPPPLAEAYPNLRRDNVAFYDYVDDFN
ncbi:hypothetical protein, partial [Staphylococcus aureus]|uniref:hypothetical protein n=1 Tax=Staphylococcus aureus TaxID=1280 RepID=UPI00301E410B